MSEAQHEHVWVGEALCAPPMPNRAAVLFRCTGCRLITYGEAVPDLRPIRARG